MTALDYSAMDHFCKKPTWDTLHGHDQRRFVEALLCIIDHPDFAPAAMVEYISKNYAQPIWPKSEDQIDAVLARLEEQAFAVWYSRGGGMS
jgi:hypothetical protein